MKWRGLACALVLVPTSVRADDANDKAVCIAASETAQRLRDDQHLLAARRELLTCGREVCPAVVKRDCTELLADVTRRTPTVVIRATGPKGEDVIAATLTIDGVRVAERITGEPVPLDPGPHDVRLEGEGARVRKQIVVVQGEHERLFAFDLRPDVRSTGSGQRIAGLVVGAVGLVGGLALGIPFGLKTIDDKNAQIAACASTSTCNDMVTASRAHDDAVTSGAISTVAFIAGGVLLAAGLIVFFTAPHERSRTSALHIGPSGIGGTF